jgi:hypothetical protein
LRVQGTATSPPSTVHGDGSALPAARPAKVTEPSAAQRLIRLTRLNTVVLTLPTETFVLIVIFEAFR